MNLLASTSSDILDYALALFFVLSGVGLAYMLFRLGGTFGRLSSFIRGTERELLPVIEKSGGTIDRVNRELDKLDVVTDSAVSMAESADTAVRAVSTAITAPVKKVSGLSAAISHGFAALRARRDPGEAVNVAKEAARRREAELEEELRQAGSADAGAEPDVPPAA
jgi:copper chaperone CopZ